SGVGRGERSWIEVRPLTGIRTRLVQLREELGVVPRLQRRLGLDEPRLDTRRHRDRCSAAAVALLGPEHCRAIEARDGIAIDINGCYPRGAGIGHRPEREPVLTARAAFRVGEGV